MDKRFKLVETDLAFMIKDNDTTLSRGEIVDTLNNQELKIQELSIELQQATLGMHFFESLIQNTLLERLKQDEVAIQLKAIIEEMGKLEKSLRGIIEEQEEIKNDKEDL